MVWFANSSEFMVGSTNEDLSEPTTLGGQQGQGCRSRRVIVGLHVILFAAKREIFAAADVFLQEPENLPRELVRDG
jgi:hypothetical protein